MIAQLPSVSEMEERLTTWCERYRVPGAALAYMHSGDVYAAAAGVTNVNTGVSVTPDTLFQIGSITKVYTTTLIMQLVDEGRIDLDASPLTYLPGLRFSDPVAQDAITIRHLLTHTSGVDGDFFDDFGRGDDAVERYVDACATLDQLFPPGAMWSYCNAGFVVLGRIIEVLTGMTWDDALKSRLLEPLGVKHTVTLPEEALLHNTAAGHNVLPSLQTPLVRQWGMTGRGAGPAGATPCSTVGDMLAFAKMHLNGGVASDGKRLLSDTSARAMTERQVTLPASPGEFASHWGLGWMIFDWGGRRVIGHDGGTIGQQSSLRILPDERFAVALLTNSVGGSLLASRVMRWLFGQVMGIAMPARAAPPEIAPEIDLTPYEGVYERLGFRITITLNDGKLLVATLNTGPLATAEDQYPAVPMYPIDASLFVQQVPLSGAFQPVVFSEFDSNGRPRYMFASRVARRVEGGAP